MTRARLFSLRFAGTAGLLLVAFVLLRHIWFPSGYFQIFDIGKLFLVLVVAVVVAGPVLSTVVFKPGKKGLVLDLCVLAGIELVIFSWGLLEISERRPIYAVFAVDRFEAVTAQEIDASQIRYPVLRSHPGVGPRLVYAELPTDVGVKNRLIDETVFDGMADIDRRPEFWKPYPRGMTALKEAVIPLSELIATGESQAAIVNRWLRRRSWSAADFVYLPIQGSRADGTIILHAKIGYPVDVLPIEPW